MKKLFEAIFHLYFFKPYTYYDRWFEISMGIAVWLNLFIFGYSLYRIIINLPAS